MKDPTVPAVTQPVDGPKRQIMICLYAWYYFRQLAPAIEIWARQGHRVHIVVLRDDRDDFKQGVVELAGRVPGISFELGPIRRGDWRNQATALRHIVNYMQFLEPRFVHQGYYRSIVQEHIDESLPKILETWPLSGRIGREAVRRIARRFDHVIPPAPEIEAIFDRVQPDVFVVTPLIDIDGVQTDYQKSAQARGIPAIYPVHSWDNLSRKARTTDLPDRVLVWNNVQVKEAIAYQRIPRRLITVTGAQGFDEWFERRPSRSREEFCATVGLGSRQPFVLYLCSAILPRHVSGKASEHGTELPFLMKWLARFRASADPTLRGAGVLFRPHPKRHMLLSDVDLGAGNVTVFPRSGQLPNSAESKELFFDSLYYCSAVVGLNTSAMIEAGIVGRPVFTVLEPDYAIGQGQMQHFKHLLNVGGGLVSVAETIDEHLAQLADALRNPEPWRNKVRSFVEAFVRPLGLDQPAAPIFARAVLEAAAMPTRRRRTSALDALLLSVLERWQVETPDDRNERVKAETLEAHRQKKRIVRDKVREERLNARAEATLQKARRREEALAKRARDKELERLREGNSS